MPEFPAFAERAVLGAILLNHTQTMPRVIESIGDNSAAFTIAEHQQVYAAMLALHERAELIDPTSVYLQMERDGNIPDIAALSGFFDMPTAEPGYVGQYIRSMLEGGKQRSLQAGINRINSALASGEDISTLQSKLIDIAESLPSSESPHMLDVRRVLETTPPDQSYIFEGTIPSGALVGVWSQGGLGKSFVMTQLAVSAAIGETLIKSFIPKRTMRVIYYASEDTHDELHRRIRAIMHRYGLHDESTQARMVENLRIYPRTNFPMATETNEGVKPTPEFQRVLREVREFGANIVIFDPLAHFLNIEENSNVEMAVAMNVFQRLIEPNTERSVVLVHHVSKVRQDSTDTGASRGASAFRDAIRCGWGFAALNNDEVKRFKVEERHVWRYMKVENTKCNWGARHSRPIFLKREEGGVLAEVDFQEQYAAMKLEKRFQRDDDDDEVPF